MATMKHTPLTISGHGQNWDVVSDYTQFFASTNTKEKAQLIARATNCHDELVAALNDLAGGFFGSLVSAASAAPPDVNVIVPVDLIKLWDAKLHAILAKATKGE